MDTANYSPLTEEIFIIDPYAFFLVQKSIQPQGVKEGTMRRRSLEEVMTSKSVVVIGASTDERKAVHNCCMS